MTALSPNAWRIFLKYSSFLSEILLALFGLTEQADKFRKIVVRVGFYELDALGIMERAHIIAGLLGTAFKNPALSIGPFSLKSGIAMLNLG